MPIDHSAQDALADAVMQGDAAARSQAVQVLLERSLNREDIRYSLAALDHALTDGDESVRVAAARALVRFALGSRDRVLIYLERDLDHDDDKVHELAVAALAVAAQSRRDLSAVARAIMPFVLAGLRAAEGPRERVVALSGLVSLEGCGLDLSLVLSDFKTALGDDHYEVVLAGLRGLAAAHGQGCDVAPFLPELQAVIARDTAHRTVLRFSTARFMGAFSVATGDEQLAGELLTHSSSSVREGAALGVSEAPEGDFAALVGHLAGVLNDPNGGVIYHAVRALDRAATAGADVEPAVATLRGHLMTPGYPEAGWVLGTSTATSDDRIMDLLSEDSATVLTRHYVNQRDRDAVAALLVHDGAFVGGGTERALRAIAEHTSDELKRRWIGQIFESR